MPANRPNRRPAAGRLLIANPPAPCSPAPGLPLPRRPAPRRLLAAVALAALLILLAAVLVAPVSAETIIDEELIVYKDLSARGEETYSGGSPGYTANGLKISDIHNYKDMKYIAFTFHKGATSLQEGSNDLTYTLNGVTNTCRIHVQKTRDIFGTVKTIQYLIFFDNWDIGSLTGTQIITFSQPIYTGKSWAGARYMTPADFYGYGGGQTPEDPRSVLIVGGIDSKNHLTIDDDGYDYTINLKRVYSGDYFISKIDLKHNDNVTLTDFSQIDFFHMARKTDINNIVITLDSEVFTYILQEPIITEPDSARVSVYVRNSQTGALLANARLTIQDTTTDPWTEVVNETLSSGQGSFSLPKDTGIHLTQYRIGATVPGYQQVVPALFARVTGPTNIVVEMEPTAGGPEDPNNAYLEFYVRDIHANGIPNANVLVDGKTRWTNGQGYTQFEVAKNATYPYTVSKSGYMTIQGSAIVADGPRYVANVVLGPGTVPTNPPTLGPGETPGGPGATPTPDTRTNEQKGQAIIDLIADFAEPIALLAIVATVFGLMQMMMPRRR